MDVKTFLDSKKKRQDTITSMFGFDEKTPTAKEAISKVKEEADKNERHKYGIAGDMREGVTGLFGQLGDLAEYGWTRATNKNEDWGINDFKKYNEYSKKMTASQSEDEYTEYYKKMVDEGVINESKYNKYLDDQKKDKNYAFNQAKDQAKDVFNNKFESALSPIMKQAQNRYQIDAISKGIKEIEDQYSMAFENAMNAYNDTRDDRILDEWLKTSKEYEDNITKVAEEWAKKIVAGKTYGDAYSETIKDAANKQAANEIVSLERRMTDKLYDYTIDRNFNDANEYASAGNLFQSLNSTLLGAKNYITWGLQHLNYATEELKQDITGRYDVTEELANLYVFDEDASGITKTLGGAKWVGNWMLDSLPQLAPLVGELLATRKIPGGMLKKLDKTIDATKGIEGFTRAGNRRISRLLTDLTMDNLVYDTSFQTLVGHPITGEEENLNLLFNGMIDSAQAMLHAPAKFFNNGLKPSDIMNTNISRDALEIAKQLDDENLGLLTEKLVLLRGMEITEGTKANKAWLDNFFDIEELRKTDPDLVAKYEKIQKNAYDYSERIQNNKANLDDAMLTFEDLKGRKAEFKTSTLEKLDTVAEDILKRSTTIKSLGDYIFSGAKSISQTFKNALADGRITEANLRLAVKSVTNVEGVDDLILGLAKGDATLRNMGLAKIAESGKKLTREEINQIYNGTIIDILEKNGKGDLLKTDEWLGTFKKTNDGTFVDVYGVMGKENGNDKFKTYTYDEVKDSISKNLTTQTLGADKFQLFRGIEDTAKMAEEAIKGGANPDTGVDLLPVLSRVQGLQLGYWGAKTTAEKTLLRETLTAVGLKPNIVDDKLVGITGSYAAIMKLHNDIVGLGNKGLDEYGENDLAAYKMLFFADIYNSFKTNVANQKLVTVWDDELNRKVAKFNEAEYEKMFKTYFEQQFEEIEPGRFVLKAALRYDKEAMDVFKQMFQNNASFKEIENEAANNLIKNILKEADLQDINDQTLYNRVKEFVCGGKYLAGHEGEAMPIVNSLFNQAKWMRSMGMSDDSINVISKAFSELVVDGETITSLSHLNSDYLYKTIISKLILEDDRGAIMYKDGLMKMFDRLPSNQSNASFKKLMAKTKSLTAQDIPAADKEIFLNKVQGAMELSKVKQADRRFSKDGGVKVKNGIYDIPNCRKLKDEDIDKLSSIIATNVFHRNNLPGNTMLDKLKNAISNTLENLRVNGGEVQFSTAQTLEKSKGALNLSLLGDIQLMQLLKDPDNMLSILIGKQHLLNNMDGIDNIIAKMEKYEKEGIGPEYKNAIISLKGIIEGGFDKDADELIDDLIKKIDERGIDADGNIKPGLLNKGAIINRLEQIYSTVEGKGISSRRGDIDAIDDNIKTIDGLIDIMNVPSNPIRAQEIADELYQIRQILERSKELFLSKKTAKEFQSDLSSRLNSLEHLNKNSDIYYNNVISKSPTAQKIWDMEGTTNDIHYDSPLDFDWKPFEGKRFVLLDTETSGLEKDDKIIQLSYRVLEVKNGKMSVNKNLTKTETYKFPHNMSKWSLKNAEENGIKEGKKAFGPDSKLYKELSNLSKDSNTYFVGHNIDFDLEKLANKGLNIKDNIIATDLTSMALMPVGVKNHKQETLRDAYAVITDAVQKIKQRDGIEGAHHNAEVDVLELEAILPFIMNNAIKNKKVKTLIKGKVKAEEIPGVKGTLNGNSVLKLMKDITRDMTKEKNNSIFSPSALPFYKFENNWKPYGNTNDMYFTYDIPDVLNQMFGSNSTREYIPEFMERFNEKFPSNNTVLNVHDVINTVADKLGDEKALYIFAKLKDIIPADAVISVDKILLGEEVKDGFIQANKIMPNLTFSEYCTNRLVANMLSSVGQYNEETIRALNNLIEPNIQTIAIDKLVKNGHGTRDTEAFMKLIDRLNDEGLLNLGEKGSGRYAEATQKILEKIRGSELKDPSTVGVYYKLDENGNTVIDEATGLEKTKLIKFSDDSLVIPLTEFNKTLSDYIKGNSSVENLSYKAKDLLSELFGHERTQGGEVVFEGGLFPEYMGRPLGTSMVGTIPVHSEETNKYILQDLDIPTINSLISEKQTDLSRIKAELEKPLSSDEIYKMRTDIYRKWQTGLRDLDSKVEKLKKQGVSDEEINNIYKSEKAELDATYMADTREVSAKESSARSNSEKLIDEAKNKFNKGEISYDEYDKEINTIRKSIANKREQVKELEEDIKDLENARKNKEDELAGLNYAEETELGQDMKVSMNKVEVETNDEEINASMGKTALGYDWQESNAESRLATNVQTAFLDDDFVDNLYNKNTLRFNNLFLVDETAKSSEEYIKTSFNGIIDMLRRVGGANKDEALSYLKTSYEEIAEKLSKLSNDYNNVRYDLANMKKGKLTSKQAEAKYAKAHKKAYENYEEYLKLNSVHSYLDNAIKTFEGRRVTVTPENVSEIYGFNKGLIGAKTNQGTIRGIDVDFKLKDVDDVTSFKLFGEEEFDKNTFMKNYLDGLDGGLIKIRYTLERSDGLKEKEQWIYPSQLFDTPFGRYVLEQYGITRNDIPAGEYNKTLPAISFIKKAISKQQKSPEWRKYRVWGKSGNRVTGPWTKWDTEDEWIKGIDYSSMKYEKARLYLKGEVAQQYDDLFKGFNKYNEADKITKDAADEFIKNMGYNSIGDFIYKEGVDKLKDKAKIGTDWRDSKAINDLMNPLVTDKGYKEAIDKELGTTSLYRKLDNYMYEHDKSLEYEAMIDKIVGYNTKVYNKQGKEKTLRVIGYEPPFYLVKKGRDLDPSTMANDLDYPNPDAMADDIVEIYYPGKYVSNSGERNELLRELDIENNAGDTYEYVHDMDEVKVLVEDDEGNLYEGRLDIRRGGRTEESINATRFRLRDLQEHKVEGELKPKEEVQLEDETADSIKKEHIYYGNRQQKDWSKSQAENNWKTAKEQRNRSDDKKLDDYYDRYEGRKDLENEDDIKKNMEAEKRGVIYDDDETTLRDVEEQSSAVKIPEDTKEKVTKTNEDIDKDSDIILEDNPFKEKEDKIWNSRILNFTNYDIVNQSEELQQIVGLRVRFISEHGEDLKKAVAKFNETIEGYDPEQQKKIYDMIRNKAEQLTRDIDSSSRADNPGEANMIVTGLPDKVQEALNGIGQVFVQGKWNPQYQYMTLSYKNDGFEGVLKNIGHNHKGAAIEYRRATGENLREYIYTLARRNVKESEVKNLVGDILGDPLGTGTMNKMLMGIRSMWRFIKYGPILYPLSGVMMLANSALLGVMRYGSESAGFRGIMNNPVFDRLIKSKADGGLGFADALNRTNEIMFNSNSDLGGSWFDKVLDLAVSPLPEGRLKNVVSTAMKGGTHSLFDLCAQGSVKSMELAKALEKNLVGWGSIDDFVKGLEAGTIPDEMINKILADTEKGYSRFFTNSATTLFSRHKFSRLYMFNALQGYVINRTDEIFSSIKDAVNWIGRRNGKFNWNDFTDYLQYNNQELKGLLMNVLLSAKLGFYMDRLANGGEFNAKEYSDYMVDTSDYLSSIPATFFYGILTAPLTGIEDYAEYAKQNNEDFDIGNGLTVAGLNTISEVMSKFFREGKVLNAMMDSVVAFGKTGNIEFAYDVLESEFSNIANGLGRFQLAEGTHKYGLDYMNQPGDMLGKILLNSDKTSQAGRIQDKLYSLQTVDGILNGESGERWKSRLLPYIPVIGQVLQNSITGQGFTFTQAKWKELQHIMDKDPVVGILNNRDQMNKEDGQYIWRDEKIFSDDAVDRMYKELTAFDYPNRARKNGTEFKIGYEGELEHIKETVFTDEILRGLGWTEEDLTKYLNDAGDRKQAGLAKIMAAAEASRPGSSKIVISYLANQEEYNLLKEVTGKPYPSSNDVTDEEMAAIQRQVLQDYYPHMFLADKTSWYKAITEYVSGNYEVFKDLYKDDDMTGYLSTLGYMDMIMYQQAKQGNVNAKYIKNSWTMLSKYFKSEPARLNAIDYVMNSIENSGMSRGREASAKMGVLAANMDFYDKIQKSGMMNALYGDDIERYNWFVWGVLKDINEQGLNLSSQNKKYSGNKYYKPYNQGSGLGENNIPMAQKFVPAAQKYLDGWTPSGTYSPYRGRTYSPTGSLDFYWNYYEALIKDYSDRLVKQRSKTYPAEYTEPLTYKREQINRGNIRAQQLVFPKHKSKEYRTNVFSNLPGAHG